MDRLRSRSTDNNRDIEKRTEKGKFLYEGLNNNNKNTEVCKYTNIVEVENATRDIKNRKDRMQIYVKYCNKLCGEISQILDNLGNFGNFYKEQAKELHNEYEKLKVDINSSQEKALKGKNIWKFWRIYETSSSDYHNKRQGAETELSEKYCSLNELHNRAQELYEDAKKLNNFEKKIKLDEKNLKDELRKVGISVYKLIKLCEDSKIVKKSCVCKIIEELQNYKGEYRQLQKVVIAARKSLEASFEDMKEGKMEISFDQLEQQLTNCWSAMKALKGWVRSDYLGRVERVLEVHVCIENLFTKLPDYHRDQHQEKFDELRERALNPGEEHPGKAERDYIRYMEDFNEIVAADKPKRLSDLDKRAKDLIGKLPDHSRDEYQKQFDELREKASSDWFPLDPLIAEKEYRQLIEKREKETPLLPRD